MGSAGDTFSLAVVKASLVIALPDDAVGQWKTMPQV